MDANEGKQKCNLSRRHKLNRVPDTDRPGNQDVAVEPESTGKLLLYSSKDIQVLFQCVRIEGGHDASGSKILDANDHLANS